MSITISMLFHKIIFQRANLCDISFLFPSLFLASVYCIHQNDLYHGSCARSMNFVDTEIKIIQNCCSLSKPIY
jgi:hypothetical protein